MKKLKVTVDGQVYEVEVEPLEAPEAGTASRSQPTPQPAAQGGAGSEVMSPLAGKVVEVKVKIGDSVSEGDTLLVLEAMKMNTLVSASASGSVQAIHASAGEMVEEGQALVTIG